MLSALKASIFFNRAFSWGSNPGKKIDFFSTEKRWHFSALKASITAIHSCTAQMLTFSAVKMGMHGTALNKTAIHSVKWHFPALQR
jgi:hypothetical protein